MNKYRARLENRPHSVYILWSDSTPVYVGMTSNWESRLNSHGVHGYYQHWNPPLTHADVFELGVTRTEAERIESEAIRDLQPLRNMRGK